MSEYTKLTSDDNNISYTAKFISENIPFGNKILKKNIFIKSNFKNYLLSIILSKNKYYIYFQNKCLI